MARKLTLYVSEKLYSWLLDLAGRLQSKAGRRVSLAWLYRLFMRIAVATAKGEPVEGVARDLLKLISENPPPEGDW